MDAASKILEILDLFLSTKDEIGITEVAKLTGINSATAYRIASIMLKRGYLEQRKKRGKYSFNTQKFVSISDFIMTRLKSRKITLPLLQELSNVVGESTQLALRSNMMAFNTDIIYTDNILNVRLSEGRTFSLYCTGVGKVFLAHMSQEEFQDYCKTITLKPMTKHTITDIKVLQEEIEKVRLEGIAYNCEEHNIQISSIAAPIKDKDEKVIAAVGILAPSSRMSRERMVELAPTLKKYAEEISLAFSSIGNKLFLEDL